MKKILLFLLLYPFCIYGQSPLLDFKWIKSTVCQDEAFYVVMGGLSNNESYSIQLNTNYPFSPKKWEFPAERKNDTLFVKTSNADLQKYNSLGLKVVSNNSASESYHVDHAVTFRPKGSVKLYSSSGDPHMTGILNPLKLNIAVNTNTTTNLELNTGEKISTWYYTESGEEFISEIISHKLISGEYYIKNATNECGPMDISGKVNVQVKKQTLIISNVEPSNLCENTPFILHYTSNDNQINNTSDIKIRGSWANGDQTGFFEIPATKTGNNALSATFPSLPENLYQVNVSLSIVSPGFISNEITRNVYRKQKIEMNQATTVETNFGTPVFIALQGASAVEFTNGQSLPQSGFLNPTQTTTYTIKSAETICGYIENPDHSPLTIQVNQGIEILDKEIISESKSLCTGNTVRIPIRHNLNTKDYKFAVVGSTYDGYSFSFEGNTTDEYIEFYIPQLQEGINRRYEEINHFQILAIPIDNSVTYYSQAFSNYRILSPPSYTAKTLPNGSLDTPDTHLIELNLKGGGPYTIVTADNKVKYLYENVYREYKYFSKADETFELKSVSNSCFSNNNPDKFHFKVSPNPNQLKLHLKVNSYVCENVELEWYANGDFGSNNTFKLFYQLSGAKEVELAQLGNQGIVQVNLPEHFPYPLGNVSFTVRSTAKNIAYSTPSYNVHNISAATLNFFNSTSSNPEEPVIYNRNNGNRIDFQTSEAILEITLLLNGNKHIITPANQKYYYSLDISSLPQGEVMELKIESLKTYCGTIESDIKHYFKKIDYSISTPYDLQNLCMDGVNNLAFQISDQIIDNNVKFYLEYSLEHNGEFKILATASNKERNFKFIPSGIKPQNYFIRVRSSDGIVSPLYYLHVNKIPDFEFQTDGKPIHVEYGQNLLLELKSDTPSQDIYYTHALVNGTHLINLPYSNASHQTTIYSDTTFMLTDIWNNCGFGKSKNVVEVTMKPRIEIATEVNSKTYCIGEEVVFQVSILGLGQKNPGYMAYSWIGNDGKVIATDSMLTRNGQITLKIPDNSSMGRNEIKFRNNEHDYTNSFWIDVNMAPDLTIMGNFTITEGNYAPITVKSNNDFRGYIRFTLSSGENRQLYIDPFNKDKSVSFLVQPNETTTYTIKNTQDTFCSAGKTSGEAVITVMPKSRKNITFQGVSSINYNICNHDTLYVHFYSEYADNEKLQLRYYSSDGETVASNPVFSYQNRWASIVPVDIPAGNYYFALESNEPDVNSSLLPNQIMVFQAARLKILNPMEYYHPNQSVTLNLEFQGSLPISYSIGDGLLLHHEVANDHIQSLQFDPVGSQSTYKISDVRNVCGPGSILETDTFTIDLITGLDNESIDVSFGPNPVIESLNIYFRRTGLKSISIYNLEGKLVLTESTTNDHTPLDLSTWQPGIYILSVKTGGGAQQFKIVKH